MGVLGWSPGGDKEIMSREEIVQLFSLERVQKSGAIFDITKLDWMNGEYIRKKSPQELVELYKPFLSDFLQIPNDYLEKIIALEQPRIKKLSEIGERVGEVKESAIIRFKTPVGKTIVFSDLIRGEISFESDLLGDFSLAKGPEIPLYNFSVFFYS